MRSLIHVPIVHSQTDLGPAQEHVRLAYVEKGGEEAWIASRKAITDFWRVLEVAIDGMCLDYPNLRIYQDGLPVCGFEEKIVRDLAQQGGTNYRILLKLEERGATIEGTEDPDLLRKEYELIMTGLPTHTAPGENSNAAVLRDLLDCRDRFIAQRIDRTLRSGETGILFLGALHHAVAALPDTIQVTSLGQLTSSPQNRR